MYSRQMASSSQTYANARLPECNSGKGRTERGLLLPLQP